MSVTRTKGKIEFVELLLSVFVNWEHDGKDYIEYLRTAKGGDEFDMRDWFVKPIFEKLGYEKGDFNHEHPLFSGKPDFYIKPTMFPPLITVETKSSFVNQKDFSEALTKQLFPAMKELHTPVGVLTNGVRLEVYHQVGKTYKRVIDLDFSGLIIAYKKKGIDGVSNDKFEKLIKLLWLKKSNQAIKDEAFYPPPDVDISESTQFEMLLDDLSSVVEMVKIDVEERFDIFLKEYEDYEVRAKHLQGYELTRLQKEKKDAIKAKKFFEKWAAINNIDLNKSNGVKEKFITETMYILVNRILLIRIAEDKEIIKRKISNGAIKDYKEYVKEIRVNYSNLLDEGYRTIETVYEHLFKRDIFDWYNPDSELLMKVLFTFNRYNFEKVNRDILGNLYQKYIDKEERKRLGQFYTPHEVIDYILDSVGYTPQNEIENKTLLDPACGSGGFLVPAVNRLIARLRNKNYDPITILAKVKDNIYGFDINPFAAHLTETNLLFQVIDLISEAKKKNPSFKMEKFNVFVTDTLKQPKESERVVDLGFGTDIEEAIRVEDEEQVKRIKLKQGQFKDGIDFVVGNPPWGAEVDETVLSQLKVSFRTTTMKNINTYALFTEWGLSYLKNKGFFGFILPETFLRKVDYEPLRELFLHRYKVISIAEVGEVFEEPKATPNAILICTKGQPTDSFEHLLLDKKADTHLRLKQIALNEFNERSLLTSKFWSKSVRKMIGVFTDNKWIQLLDKIIQNGKPLGQFRYIVISRGEEFGKKQIRKVKTNEKDFSVIYPDNVFRYHVMFNHDQFAQVENVLHDYLHPKILVIRIRNINIIERIIAAYDDHKLCPLKTLQYIYFKNDDTSMLKYILGILNSKLINFYCRHFLTDDINKDYLNSIPIVQGENSNKEFLIKRVEKIIEVEKQLFSSKEVFQTNPDNLNIVSLADSTLLSYINLEDHLGKLKIERKRKRVYLSRNNFIDFTDEKAAEYVERYLTSIQANLRGMTKAEVLRTVKIPKTIKGVEAILQRNEELKMREKELQKEKLKLESEINQLVYELYGLTKEEIRIIEKQ